MAQTLEPTRTRPPDPAHYAESSARENLIEHVFLGELLRGLWRKNVRDLEVLRPEVDSGGYDLALEFRGFRSCCLPISKDIRARPNWGLSLPLH
jgi:hypothetical protein